MAIANLILLAAAGGSSFVSVALRQTIMCNKYLDSSYAFRCFRNCDIEFPITRINSSSSLALLMLAMTSLLKSSIQNRLNSFSLKIRLTAFDLR